MRYINLYLHYITLRFFSLASDGATAERRIQNRVFWSILQHFEDRIVLPIMDQFGRSFQHLLEE